MTDAKRITWFVGSDVEVGDMLLLGRFGGAYANRYRVAERIDQNRALLVLQRTESVRYEDGTFGHRYLDA